MPPESSDKLSQAMQLVTGREYSQAEKLFGELIQAGSEVAPSYYGMGLARFASGQLESARAFFEKCLDLDPTHSNSYYFLGQIAEKKQDRKAADYFYGRALEINPRHAGALKSIGVPKHPVPPPHQEDPPGVSRAHVNSDREPTEQDAKRTGDASTSKSQGYLQSDLYALLRRTQEPVEQEISHHLDQIANRIGTRRKRFRAYISVAGLLAALSITLMCFIAMYVVSSDSHFDRNARDVIPIAILFFLFLMWFIAPLGSFLRARTSKISCDRDWLLSTTGVFNKATENAHLFLLSRGPVSVRQTLMNRLTNDGTLELSEITLRGYFRKTDLDELSTHFRQLSLLSPTNREILAAIGELKNIRSGAQ